MSTVVMFQAQNRKTVNSTCEVVVSFKIIMTTSVTTPCFTTQHQTSKTKTKTLVLVLLAKNQSWSSTVWKTKTDFFGSQTGFVLRSTVSDHITDLKYCVISLCFLQFCICRLCVCLRWPAWWTVVYSGDLPQFHMLNDFIVSVILWCGLTKFVFFFHIKYLRKTYEQPEFDYWLPWKVTFTVRDSILCSRPVTDFCDVLWCSVEDWTLNCSLKQCAWLCVILSSQHLHYRSWSIDWLLYWSLQQLVTCLNKSLKCQVSYPWCQ